MKSLPFQSSTWPSPTVKVELTLLSTKAWFWRAQWIHLETLQCSSSRDQSSRWKLLLSWLLAISRALEMLKWTDILARYLLMTTNRRNAWFQFPLCTRSTLLLYAISRECLNFVPGTSLQLNSRKPRCCQHSRSLSSWRGVLHEKRRRSESASQWASDASVHPGGRRRTYGSVPPSESLFSTQLHPSL